MKKINTFFLACTMMLLSFACDNEPKGKESNLDQIASDPVFAEYQNAIDQNAIAVASSSYDLEKIGVVLRKNMGIPICDLSTKLFENIRGGHEYQQNACRIDQKQEELFAKYSNFSALSSSERTKIRQIASQKGIIPSQKEMVKKLIDAKKNIEQ
jgi:hypothetical protein